MSLNGALKNAPKFALHGTAGVYKLRQIVSNAELVSEEYCLIRKCFGYGIRCMRPVSPAGARASCHSELTPLTGINRRWVTGTTVRCS